MANVGIGDSMMFDGGKQWYTGTGWTSNTPGTVYNPTQASGNKPIADPWAGLQDGQFNAAGYGSFGNEGLGGTAIPPAVSNTMTNDRGGAGRGGSGTVAAPPVATPSYNQPLGSNPQFGNTLGLVNYNDATGSVPPYVDPRGGARGDSPLAGSARSYQALAGAMGNPRGSIKAPTGNGTTTPSTTPAAGTNGLPAGYYNSTGPGGTFQPQGAPTFDTYWQQRLGELQSPMITPAAWVSGIQGYSTDNATASLTPAAQWATEYVTLHPDDPAIQQAGGEQAFINKYNSPEYSLQALRPDLAAVSGGYGSGVAGSWKGLDDAGTRLLTSGVGQGMQPSFDADPSTVARSLQLNGINPNSATGQRALGIAQQNLGQPNTVSYTGGTQNSPTSQAPVATPSGSGDAYYQQLMQYLQQLMGSQVASSVQTTPLGYTQYSTPQGGLSQDDFLTIIAGILGNPAAQRRNFFQL